MRTVRPQTSLPIQLCDLASLVSAYALWTHRWWAAGLTYYWGLFLTTQAIITPDLDSGFPDPVFLLFWGMHIGTVWAAVHLAWGRGVVPDWRSYRFAVAATATWAVSVFTLNVVLGTNYALKVLWEVVATPLTYAVVGFLKRVEGEDYYDLGTDFTPFSLRA